VTLRFVNGIIYASRYIFDEITQDYINKKVIKREKQFFQYEAISTNNYKEYLNSKEPFEKKDFYSS
jgi:hypothetical protein